MVHYSSSYFLVINVWKWNQKTMIFNVFNNFGLTCFVLALFIWFCWFWTYFSRKTFSSKQFHSNISKQNLLLQDFIPKPVDCGYIHSMIIYILWTRKKNNISYLPSFSLPWTGKQKEANFVATEMLQYFEGHRHWYCKLIAFWAIYNFSKSGE